MTQESRAVTPLLLALSAAVLFVVPTPIVAYTMYDSYTGTTPVGAGVGGFFIGDGDYQLTEGVPRSVQNLVIKYVGASVPPDLTFTFHRTQTSGPIECQWTETTASLGIVAVDTFYEVTTDIEDTCPIFTDAISPYFLQLTPSEGNWVFQTTTNAYPRGIISTDSTQASCAVTSPDPGAVFVDNTGTFGAYEGVIKSAVLDETTQVVVDIQGTILDLPFLPNRPLRFWASIDSISSDPGVVTIAPNEGDAIGATLAELRLLAPGTHASFLAKFCQPGTVDFQLGFNKLSVALTIADVLVPIAGTRDIQVTASKILAFASALSAIPLYESAVNHMVSGFAAASQGRVRIASREMRDAGRDLVLLASNANQRTQLLQAFGNLGLDLGFDLTARFLFRQLVSVPARIVQLGADFIAFSRVRGFSSEPLIIKLIAPL